MANMDFRVLKYFPFGESRHLDVVAEFFNLFNHPNVLLINPVFGSGLTPIAAYGAPIEWIRRARQVQVFVGHLSSKSGTGFSLSAFSS